MITIYKNQKAPHHAQNIKPWVGWVTKAEDHIGFHFSQSTGIWYYYWYRLTQAWQLRKQIRAEYLVFFQSSVQSHKENINSFISCIPSQQPKRLASFKSVVLQLTTVIQWKNFMNELEGNIKKIFKERRCCCHGWLECHIRWGCIWPASKNSWRFCTGETNDHRLRLLEFASNHKLTSSQQTLPTQDLQKSNLAWPQCNQINFILFKSSLNKDQDQKLSWSRQWQWPWDGSDDIKEEEQAQQPSHQIQTLEASRSRNVCNI